MLFLQGSVFSVHSPAPLLVDPSCEQGKKLHAGVTTQYYRYFSKWAVYFGTLHVSEQFAETHSKITIWIMEVQKR